MYIYKLNITLFCLKELVVFYYNTNYTLRCSLYTSVCVCEDNILPEISPKRSAPFFLNILSSKYHSVLKCWTDFTLELNVRTYYMFHHLIMVTSSDNFSSNHRYQLPVLAILEHAIFFSKT